METRMETRAGSGRAEERRRSAKKRTRVVDVVRETERLGWKKKKRRQKRVGSVAANPDNLENSKKAGREAQGTQGLSKNCISRESVSPLSRLIRGFRNKYR